MQIYCGVNSWIASNHALNSGSNLNPSQLWGKKFYGIVPLPSTSMDSVVFIADDMYLLSDNSLMLRVDPENLQTTSQVRFSAEKVEDTTTTYWWRFGRVKEL